MSRAGRLSVLNRKAVHPNLSVDTLTSSLELVVSFQVVDIWLSSLFFLDVSGVAFALSIRNAPPAMWLVVADVGRHPHCRTNLFVDVKNGSGRLTLEEAQLWHAVYELPSICCERRVL